MEHISEVFLNGEKIGEHRCGYTAYSIDLSEKLRYGEENVLVVTVDSREQLNVPPFGYVIDYMTYGGVYRDVYLDIKNPDYLEDIFHHSHITWQSGIAVTELHSDIKLSKAETDLSIRQLIRKKGQGTYELLTENKVLNSKEIVKIQSVVKNAELWEVEKPVLYEIKTELLKGNQVVDENITSFGFRKAEFLKDGFYLNNKKVKNTRT